MRGLFGWKQVLRIDHRPIGAIVAAAEAMEPFPFPVLRLDCSVTHNPT
jgi:hypothetical protein